MRQPDLSHPLPGLLVAAVCTLGLATTAQAGRSAEYVTAPSVSAPSTVEPGASLGVTAVVRNIGDMSSSGATALRLYLSTDAAAGTDDRLVASAPAGGIAPGASRTIRIVGRMPTRSGAWFVLVCRTPSPAGTRVCGFSPKRLVVGSGLPAGAGGGTGPGTGPTLVAGAFSWSGSRVGLGLADGETDLGSSRTLHLRYAFRSTVAGPISVKVWAVDVAGTGAPCAGRPNAVGTARSGRVGSLPVRLPRDGSYTLWLRVADAKGGLLDASPCVRSSVEHRLDSTPPPTPTIERYRPVTGGFVLQVSLTYRTESEKAELRTSGEVRIEYFDACPTYAPGERPSREREGILDGFRAFGPFDASPRTAFLRVAPATGGRDRFEDGDDLPAIRFKDRAGNVSGCVQGA